AKTGGTVSQSKSQKISLFEALLPIIFLVSLLVINVKIYGDNATGGANQIALFLSGFFVILMSFIKKRMDYNGLENAAILSIRHSMQANLILLTVGSLIGLWILSGVVPTMIYYGVKMINPQFFLPTTCLICCLVSLSTGSSWSTGGTM